MMSRWSDVASVDELTPGSCRVVEVDGTNVAVFNLGGEYYAIEDACSHDGGELARGRVEGEEIVCPRHGARFSIRTGAVLGPPACEDLRIFPVRVAQGRVQVETE
ncbi:MAG: non-heme iron oxygenase ferredoxin subunit [Gallionella sp.]|nr:non-heme iron oxygenase ferredoxin subunit [Gallionella sp.]